jgi:hypothetical protein
MKFSDDAWALWQTKFPSADRAKAEAEMTNEQADFLRKAGGNEAKALGLLVLDTAKNMASALRLDVEYVLKQLLAYAPRKGRSKLKKAIRLARGGH